jgi:hypothetical protein
MADDGKDHGDDHETKGEGFDPWADLEAEGAADLGEGSSLSFDDASLDAGLDVPADEPAVESGTADEAFVTEVSADGEAVEDDAFVNAWLNEPTEEAAHSTPLSVFAPDDLSDVGEAVGGDAAESDWPGDPSAIEIGTGQSGVTSASDIDGIGFGVADALLSEPTGEEPVFDTASVDDTDSEGVEAVAFAATEGDEPAEETIIDFGTAAAATLAAAAADGDSVAVATQPGPAAAGRPRKRGPLRQLLGVVLGGLLAIPVVLGILIGLMWMGWSDTAGIRRLIPEQLAFLLPQARNPVAMGTTGGPDLGAAASLNELPVVADETAAVADEAPSSLPDSEPAADAVVPPIATEEPVVTEEPAATETASSSDPLAAVSAEPALTKEPGSLVADDGAVNSDPSPVADSPVAVLAEPSFDDLAAISPPATQDVAPATAVAPPAAAVPVVPEPEPLDLGGLEAAAAEATAALDAVEAVADPADPVRKTLLVDWYKRLARVAQELTTVEHLAADSGRPLSATPAVAAELGGRILAAPNLADDLARLARNWLTYSRRDGDGVVMPATFSGSRRVGPYWCSRVSIAEAGGASRELSVISRIEPVAVPGDAVIVMGLVMDGGVLWASELLSASAASKPAAVAEPDPFSQPGP